MTPTNLTDIQRAVLQAAAHSAALAAWPLPAKLKLNGGSAVIVARGLLKRALIEERPALGSDPVWRNEDGARLTLVISKAGLEAVGMLPADEAGVPAATTALDGGQPTSAASNPARMPRPGSKLAILIELLSRAEGASIAEMAVATGWQGHSVRGVLSGVLTKKLCLTVVSEKVDGRGRVYRASGSQTR